MEQKENEKYWQIDQYLRGELSGPERTDFEIQLATDKDLAAEIDLYQTIDEHLSAHFAGEKKRIALQKNLKTQEKLFFDSFAFEEEEKENKKVTAKPKIISLFDNLQMQMQMRMRMIGLATSLAAILILALLLPPFWQTIYTQNDLYAEYATKHRTAPAFVTRGGIENLLLQAENAFTQGQYAQAIQAFDAYVVQQPTQKTDILLWRGLAHLELEQFADALRDFTELSQSDTALKFEGMWYGAMVHLKQGDVEASKKQLVHIKKGADYYEDAQDLLHKYTLLEK